MAFLFIAIPEGLERGGPQSTRGLTHSMAVVLPKIVVLTLKPGNGSSLTDVTRGPPAGVARTRSTGAIASLERRGEVLWPARAF